MTSLSKRITMSLAAAVLCSVIPASQAKDWPDPLLETAGTPENVAKGNEFDAYQLGLSAYVWGYPLVRMERVAREYIEVPNPKPSTSYRAPLNQIGWARDLATPSALDMPTANNDTTYLSAVVDLSREPYILSVPDTGGRYYVVDTFNMWQELEHYIGRRVTGTKAGRFALVGPGWKGKLPAGVKRLDIKTSKVWLWGRMRVSPGEDMKKLHALQDTFDLRPLSAVGKKDWKAPAASLAPLPDIGTDPLGFYKHLGAALKDNPIRIEDKALAEQFARIGLTEKGFDPSRLNESQRKGLMRAINDAPMIPVSAVAQASEVRQGWNYVRGLDSFGYDYPLRAVVAGPYLGGQGEKEAVYPIRYTDQAGQPLDGANDYVVRFSGEPPNDAFWSLTIYDAKTKMLIDNPISRYKFGSDTQDIHKNADGSFSVTVSPRRPAESVNWLPSPSGGFYAMLRIYQPKDAIISGAWKLPAMERVSK
ncbi:DUF1254 domain-containing protein [Cupriavidus sp. SW-Y-13]|uniref:DUF1254 domain-containing protein n=1 Tax=Cupriavidus sp. SW-Y-13 TaxID=2653854 RepID=UPI0013652884|nr:DUF1254 domain-containing protein [Cupriavidus sp. SW-Y-13]MWL89591.1 DUF1254 domain-containing protein [Cupriavidus sp. SW-Y-13]